MLVSLLICLLAFCPTVHIAAQPEERTLSLLSASAPAQKYPDRREFVAKMARIRDGDTEEAVQKLLGPPDDIWREPDPVPYPRDEIWCYGSHGHLSLPTLGQVCFRQKKVIWTAGAYGVPPPPEVI